MQCTILSKEALEELPPKDWTMGNPDLGDWAFNTWSWNYPLPGDKMSMLEKKKKPTEEKVGQVKPQQGKDLNVTVAWCLPGGMSSTTLTNCCSANTSWTCRGCTMHNEGPEGPHGESSATCVQWCGWGSCSHCGCIQHVQLTWWIGPDCTNFCDEAPNFAGAGSLGHLSSPFRLLQPSVGPKLVPAKIYLLCSSKNASTVFPVGCCSIYTLTCFSSDFG